MVQDHGGVEATHKSIHVLPTPRSFVLRVMSTSPVEHVEVMAPQQQNAVSRRAEQVRFKARLLNQDALFLTRPRVGLAGPTDDCAFVEIHHAHQFGPRIGAAGRFRLAIWNKIDTKRSESVLAWPVIGEDIRAKLLWHSPLDEAAGRDGE